MAQPNRKPGEIEPTFAEKEDLGGLRSKAVAIDPPPSGAIGIQELLNRFERFAEAGELVDAPKNGAVGVRELLARLGNLADGGYFSSPNAEESEEQQT